MGQPVYCNDENIFLIVLYESLVVDIGINILLHVSQFLQELINSVSPATCGLLQAVKVFLKFTSLSWMILVCEAFWYFHKDFLFKVCI